MSDLVRKLGTVTDRFGMPVSVGTDHGDVTILGDGQLTPAQQEEFAQLFVAACHEAAANVEAARGVSADG